jgi:UDP-N-acetyl-D-mannosaminuronate dehydrogenase
MKSIVIGLGETGRPLFTVLRKGGWDTEGLDIGNQPSSGKYREMNICIPFSDKFIGIVKNYQDKFFPELTIIHSTVPIGTTSMIPDAVHSPILGKHDNMEKSLTTFTKWIGGERAFEARDYLMQAGIPCRCVATSEETEALKLLCLAKYGMSIAFAQYCKCVADDLGFNYQDILDWDIDYNAEVESRLQRPIILNPDGKVGGHCVLPGTKLLNEYKQNPILEEVLRYAR